MHVLYALPLLPTYRATVLRFLAHRSLPATSRYYRTMLELVYLQKTWLSLPKSAECHLSWIHNYSNRSTYITSHKDVLFFEKNLLSNFILEKVFEALFPQPGSDTTCGRTPNLMSPRSARLPLDTKHPKENTKLLGSIGHTPGENPKIHIFPSGSQMRE